MAVALRAKRRAGELLAVTEKNRGTVLGGNAVLPPDPTPKLADLGVSKIGNSVQPIRPGRASYWRRLRSTKAAVLGELVPAWYRFLRSGDATRARLQAVTELPPKLADLGVSRLDSSRWQAAIMAAWRP